MTCSPGTDRARFRLTIAATSQGCITPRTGRISVSPPHLDFNSADNPSCSYDPQWHCPLAPPESRITVPIEAGERCSHLKVEVAEHGVRCAHPEG